MLRRHLRALSVVSLPLAASPTYSALLAGAAILPLAACSSASTQSSAIADDIKLVAGGLKMLLSYAGLTGATLARYQAYIDDLSKLAAAVASNAMDGKSAIQQALSDAAAALDIVSGMNLSSKAKTYITAVQVLLGVLSALAGGFGAMATPQGQMTPEQARAILRSAR